MASRRQVTLRDGALRLRSVLPLLDGSAQLGLGCRQLSSVSAAAQQLQDGCLGALSRLGQPVGAHCVGYLCIQWLETLHNCFAFDLQQTS